MGICQLKSEIIPLQDLYFMFDAELNESKPFMFYLFYNFVHVALCNKGETLLINYCLL